jgi:signal transduction histidine kinase
MVTTNSVSSFKTRRTILVAAAAMATIGLIFELIDPVPGWFVRVLVDLIVIGIAIWEVFHEARADFLAQVVIGLFGTLSILDSALGTDLSTLDPATTLALLVLMAVIYAATKSGESPVPVIVVSVFIALYSVATVILVEMPTSVAAGFVLIGGPGQMVVIWLVSRLIDSLARKSEVAIRYGRIQRALAGCSQALLSRGTPEPLATALETLLDATEADYAYIDVNRTDPSGNIGWEIIAEAVGEGVPSQESRITTGDYRQLEGVVDRMSRRLPAQIVIADLPSPIRDQYESEGIRAELMAPIFIGDRWVGTLGYADHFRQGTWTDIEIDGLMRAAEMVAAYWEREAAREGLLELAQAKDRFIAAVSHELRTPLAAVVGFASEMATNLDDRSPAEIAEMASHIYTQSLEVSHLVDDLLTAERAASGNLTVTPGEINLLDECRDVVESTVAESMIEVTGHEVMAHADSLRTRQILRNLLTNATRYGGEEIQVEVSAGEGSARILVRDNGSGVKGMDAERIFDPYYRSEAATAKPDSVGLGLSVARQLARLMGGDLVYRRVSGWTEFELSLPIAEDPALATAG